MSDVNCRSCSKPMSPSDGIKCDNCNSLHHSYCVGLAQEDTSASPWRCTECKEKVAKDKPTQVHSSIVTWYETRGTMIDMEIRLRHMTNQLRLVRNQFREFRQKLQRIRMLNTFLDEIKEKRAKAEAQAQRGPSVRTNLRPLRKFKKS